MMSSAPCVGAQRQRDAVRVRPDVGLRRAATPPHSSEPSAQDVEQAASVGQRRAPSDTGGAQRDEARA